MFGAWQAGVWKALCGRFKPDLIVGASAGAWNGWSIAGGATADDLIGVWRDPLTGKIMQRGLHSTGIVVPTLLHQRAQELFSRYQPRIPFGLTVVEVPRLRLRLFRNPDIGWRHLAATCSIPFCFPPVPIEGRKYVDGGVLGALPLWAAEEMGATRAVALNALTIAPFRWLRPIFARRRASPALKVTLIEPSRKLGRVRDAFVWSAENIRSFIELGERDGNRAVSSITM